MEKKNSKFTEFEIRYGTIDVIVRLQIQEVIKTHALLTQIFPSKGM